MTVAEITEAQDAIFGRIQAELENGYDNAIHDSYQSRTILQFAQAIKVLDELKRTADDAETCGLPFHTV